MFFTRNPYISMILLTIMKRLIKRVYNESRDKHIILLSSSSTFFLLLSIVPFLLLLLKSIGLLLGESQNQAESILKIVTYFLPNNLEGLASPIKNLLINALFASKDFTLLNAGVLLISAFGFINSIWRGLLVITEDNSIYDYKKYFKGFLLILSTLLLFLSSLIIPLLTKGTEYILSFSIVKSTLDFFHLENLTNFGLNYIFNNGWIAAILIILYMSFFFKLLLGNRASWKNSLKGSSLFYGLLLILKLAFSYYMNLTKEGLISSYGSYYGFIFILIWILSLMVVFYFSIIVSLSIEYVSNEPPPIPEQ